ncbi:ferric reductase-like transmembrane domain-containing protein [uncultured Amphritea sp.]|uniref:ferredoxin reductase family protein n=1 Tax=uncultured Amphritea sp. TaxID=981605 RepID=UPI0026036EC5|nr:ferric reductase-like transmembrane domain-containing protein [uncultured Amphritea sp.]
MKQQKLSITLALITAGILMVWGFSYQMTTTVKASLPWEVYDNSLYVSGLLSIAFMSVTMMLATRPRWLEAPFNGLDQIYRLHKWSGILAVLFALSHWLIEMGDDLIKALFGRAGRLPEQDFSGFTDMMREAAEAIGEWGVYLVFGMLILTLWKRFPYNLWRYAHRAMPLLYLSLVFHTVWLVPLVWWQQPIGWLMGLLLAGGSVASLLSIKGLIGRSRRVQGTITAISTSAMGIIEVECQLERQWKGHRAGQFAFVSFDHSEGAHPFTIASADHGNGQISFQIKGLGDYTRQLGHRLKIGQPVTVEGPYGQFYFKQRQQNATQIWIAGGIGVTPFLAWLESLQNQADKSLEAEMHYCIHDSAKDPFVERLQEACNGLSGIQLHIHDSSQGSKLTAKQLLAEHPETKAMEVWFCGPSSWASSLEKALRESLKAPLSFRQEAFELR